MAITASGPPQAQIVPESGGRRQGRSTWAGRARMPDDFDITPPDVLASFGEEPG